MKVPSIEGIVLHTQQRHMDHRGYFSTLFPNGQLSEVKQIGQSQSKQFTLRGLHFQAGMAKTMRVLKGRIMLVSVDLRRNSPTFLDHTVEYLTSMSQFHSAGSWCARGFVAEQDDTIVEYFHSDVFKPELAFTISWNDPTLGIEWTLEARNEFILSEKDQFGGRSVDEWLAIPESHFPEFQYKPQLTIVP
jgi:dTDP-4-dehydrorhamnose 3,5-epimerase